VNPEEVAVLAIGVYLVLLVAVAEAARRARVDRSPDDHFLAGRHLGAFVLFFTLYATSYSGNSLLGYPGEAYRRGYLWIMATGFMMAVTVVFHLLVPRMRPIAIARGFVTPGDWIRDRFDGDRGAGALRIAVAILMTIALANYLLAQLTAMGVVASEATGGRIPYSLGVVGLAGMILFYETLGGMRAVAWTDAVQGALMIGGLALMMGWLLRETGGLGGVTQQVAALRPDAVQVPDARSCANWASTVLLLGFGSVVYPQAIQRVFAARSARALRRALGAMSFMPLVTTTVVAMIGVAAIPKLQALGVVEADSVMPRLLGTWAAEGFLAVGVATLIFVGALAAIMSTADSVILSLGSLVAADLLGRARHDPATTRAGKRLAVGIMLAMVAVALLPRTTLWRLIELKMELLIQCVPSFLLALYWGRLRAPAALLGLAVGTAMAGGAALADIKRIAGVHVGLLGLASNVAVCAVFTWFTPRRVEGHSWDAYS